MTVIIAFSVILNLLVVYKAWRFFRLKARCRESDRSIVAVFGLLSLLVSVSLMLVYGASPWEIHGPPIGNSLLTAVNFVMAMAHLGFIESVTGRKVCRPSQSEA